MGGGQAVRVLRCAVFATATTVLAALAHAASGTILPSGGVLLAAGAGVGLAAFPLTRRERGLPAVLGATLGGQLVLHLVLTLAMVPSCSPTGAGAASGALPVMSGMGAGGAADLGAGCTTGSWLPMTAPGRSPGLMVALHLLAALVLAWWLRRGERALARCAVVVAGALVPLARRLAGVRPVLDQPLPGPIRAGLGPVRRVARARHPGLRGAQVWARRGPPGVLAA